MGMTVTQKTGNFFVKQKSGEFTVTQKTGMFYIKEVANAVSGGVVAPSNQPTSMVFSIVTSSSYTVSWTASVGGADVYLAIRRTSASPTYVPVDGTTYSVGDTVGDGEVRHFGAGVTFDESGLSSSTEYFYDIFAGNGTTGTWVYLTTSPLEDSRATLFDFGNALHYNGANMNDRTEFTTLSASVNKWTWKVWFKIDANGSYYMYTHYNNSSRRRQLEVGNTFLRSNVRNAVNSAQTYTGTIKLNTWYCWFIVYDYSAGATNGDRVKFYLGEAGVDANLVQLTLGFSNNVPSALSTIDGVSRIFWGSAFGSGLSTFNGVMDERAMWDVGLTYSQCDAMYNGGNGAENLAANCVFYQKLDESDPATVAVEEIAGLDTTLVNCTFTPGTDGWEAH